MNKIIDLVGLEMRQKRSFSKSCNSGINELSLNLKSYIGHQCEVDHVFDNAERQLQKDELYWASHLQTTVYFIDHDFTHREETGCM